MSRWLVAVAVLVAALLVALYVKLSKKPPAPEVRPAAIDAGAAAKARTGPPPRPGLRPEPGRPTTDAQQGKVDPKSDAFSHRIDVVIPNKLRARVAECYQGGKDPDASLKVQYTLRISGGEVTTSGVQSITSEVGAELKACMLEAVRKARWRADDMPDFTEEKELFIRLRTLKKYKSRKLFEEGR